MSTYIHPNNRDTRYPLWFDRYRCRVPFIQTLSIEELEQNGLPSSGDRYHDHAMQWEPRLMSIPIVRMAELWASGANISLVDSKDSPQIYKAISAHLFAWKAHIEQSYNPVKPPYEDLLILDQFASIVYEKARFAYDQAFVAKHFKMTSATSIGRRAMLASMQRNDLRRQDDADKGLLRLNNINFSEAVAEYNPDADIQFIDYSGTDAVIDAPSRNSLASFFKKGKK